jgi:hypothetical protein
MASYDEQQIAISNTLQSMVGKTILEVEIESPGWGVNFSLSCGRTIKVGESYDWGVEALDITSLVNKNNS